MPPKKLPVVSQNFVKNDYRRNGKKTRKMNPRGIINLGERYANGKLKVTRWKSKYEWIAEKKDQMNDRLYLELLNPDELQKLHHIQSTKKPDEKDNTTSTSVNDGTNETNPTLPTTPDLVIFESENCAEDDAFTRKVNLAI